MFAPRGRGARRAWRGEQPQQEAPGRAPSRRLTARRPRGSAPTRPSSRGDGIGSGREAPHPAGDPLPAGRGLPPAPAMSSPAVSTPAMSPPAVSTPATSPPAVSTSAASTPAPAPRKGADAGRGRVALPARSVSSADLRAGGRGFGAPAAGSEVAERPRPGCGRWWPRALGVGARTQRCPWAGGGSLGRSRRGREREADERGTGRGRGGDGRRGVGREGRRGEGAAGDTRVHAAGARDAIWGRRGLVPPGVCCARGLAPDADRDELARVRGPPRSLSPEPGPGRRCFRSLGGGCPATPCAPCSPCGPRSPSGREPRAVLLRPLRASPGSHRPGPVTGSSSPSGPSWLSRVRPPACGLLVRPAQRELRKRPRKRLLHPPRTAFRWGLKGTWRFRSWELHVKRRELM